MNAEEMRAKAEGLRREAEGIREAAKLCADLDEATEERERALQTEEEAERLDRLANAYEDAQKEFAWSIRTMRLCAATIKKHFNGASQEEAEKTTKAEAMHYIEKSLEHCESWLLTQRTGGQFAEDEEQAARQGMADIEAKAREQAKALPN